MCEMVCVRVNVCVEVKGGWNDLFLDVLGLLDVEVLMVKYVGDVARGAARAVKGALRGVGLLWWMVVYDGVFVLLFINFVLFVCDYWVYMVFVKMLYLNYAKSTWW